MLYCIYIKYNEKTVKKISKGHTVTNTKTKM